MANDFSAAAANWKARFSLQREGASPERVKHLDLMEATCDEAAKRLGKAKDRDGALDVMTKLHGEYLATPLANAGEDSARSEPLGPIAQSIRNP